MDKILSFVLRSKSIRPPVKTAGLLICFFLLIHFSVYSDEVAEKVSPATATTNATIPPEESTYSSANGDGKDVIQKADPNLDDKDAERHFELYLDSSPIAQARIDEYLNNFSQVLSFLKDGDDHRARELLNILNTYPDLDAGLSEQLGRRIDAIWEIKQIKSRIEVRDKELENTIDQPDKSSEEIGDAVRKQKEEQDKGAQSGADLPGVPLSSELTQVYVKDSATRSKVNEDRKNNAILWDQSRNEFLLYIKNLYLSKHYQHVVMAAKFYPQLYGLDRCPSETELEVEDAFGKRENIKAEIWSLKNEWKQGNIDQAANELRTAYFINNTDPDVLGVPAMLRNRIKTFNLQITKLDTMIQEKHFAGCEELLEKIKQEAPHLNLDSDAQIIESSKKNSQRLLNQGKFEIRRGNFAEALKNLQEAERMWSDNPDLRGGAQQIISSEEARQQVLTEFDRLFSGRDYSAIAKRRFAFTDVLDEDSERKSKLENAVKIASDVEINVKTAEDMQSTGNMAGAWEAVCLALDEWPDNAKLVSLREDLANKAAKFVLAIVRARNYENRHELGISLSWYAVAKKYYPDSLFAKQGINRISKVILK